MSELRDDAIRTIKKAVAVALAGGEGFSPDLSDLAAAAAAGASKARLVPVRIAFEAQDDPLKGLDLFSLARLFAGLPLASYVPADKLMAPITGLGAVGLQSITFVLLRDGTGRPVELRSMGVVLDICRDQGGFSVQPFDGVDFKASLTSLALVVTNPLSKPSGVLDIEGAVKFGGLDLALGLEWPSMIFLAREVPQPAPSLAALVAGFGLQPPPALAGLLLESLQLALLPRDGALSLSATIATPKAEPFDLIPGVLAIAGLALEVGYTHGSDATDSTLTAGIGADVVLNKKIVLSAVIAKTDNGWSGDLRLNLPGTLALAYPDDKERQGLALGDLIELAGAHLPDDLASFFDTVSLEGLGGSIGMDRDKPTYSVSADFKADWRFGNYALDTATSLTLSNAETKVAATAVLDGFVLELEWSHQAAAALAGGASVITVRAPSLTSAAGTIDTGQETVTIGPIEGAGAKLGTFLADFVGLFTGDTGTTLPEPWGSMVDAVDLPKLTLKLDFGQCELTLTGEVSYAFLGCRLDGFTLGYRFKDRGKGKPRGLLFSLKGDFPILDQDGPPSWDPSKPSQAPRAPGLGGAYFDIAMLTLGQHVALDPAPTDMKSGLAALQALTLGTRPARFDAASGWLVAGRFILFSQVDLRLLFADPTIYGLSVQVADKPIFGDEQKFAWIDLIKGLYFDIVYRKVSPSVGVYACALTLPDDIRKAQLGAFEIQLPSFALEVYTNGDFLIDVGFPHNADFSHSAALSAGQYYGAGGLLFGALSGATADKLPDIPAVGGQPIGFFSSVIDLGLGVEIGIVRSFASGPMTAELDVLLQAIFEGLFAKFTTYATPNRPSADDEYFSVSASLALIGKLHGRIDFSVVTAEFLVEVVLAAAVEAVAHQTVKVPLSAKISVDLTVSIDCGICTIHLHLSFAAEIDYTVQFGEDSKGLWESPGDQAAAIAGPPDGLGGFPALHPLDCPPIKLDLIVTAPLTAGGEVRDDPYADYSGYWAYVVQFALFSPETRLPHGVHATTSGEHGTVDDFIALLVAWLAVNHLKRSERPRADSAKQLYEQVQVTRGDLTDLHALLHNHGKDRGVLSERELKRFFKANLSFVPRLAQAGEHVAAAFFPMLPALSVHSDDATVAKADAGTQLDLLRDYVMATALAALDAGARVLAGTSESVSLAVLFAKMAQSDGGGGLSAMASVAGFGSRLLLHGAQVDGRPVVGASGQEVILMREVESAPVLTVIPKPGEWGLAADAGTLSIATAYGAKDTAGFAQKVQTRGLPLAFPSPVEIWPRRFALARGLPAEGGGKVIALRALPRGLKGLLAGGGLGDCRFTLSRPGPAGSSKTVGAGSWQPAAVVEVILRRARATNTADGGGGVLAGCYELAGLGEGGLPVLKALYRAVAGGQGLGGLLIGWKEGGVQALRSIDDNFLLFRTNLSLETNPAAEEMGIRLGVDAKGFVTLLLTGALTHSGGYYLRALKGGLPEALFSQGGTGRITICALGLPATGDDNSLPPYATSLVLTDATLTASEPLHLTAPALLQASNKYSPYTLRVSLVRPAPSSAASDPDYQQRLNAIYNLVVFCPRYCIYDGRGIDIPRARARVVGPKIQDGSSDHSYEAFFDIPETLGFGERLASDGLIDWGAMLKFDPMEIFTNFRLVIYANVRDLYGHEIPMQWLECGHPAPVYASDVLEGMRAWPGLVFDYHVRRDKRGKHKALLTITRRWSLPKADLRDDARRNNLIRRYVALYRQLQTSAVEVKASFLHQPLSGLRPVWGQPDDVCGRLRADIEKILSRVSKGRSSLDLEDLVFELPDNDEAFVSDAMVPLKLQMVFNRVNEALIDPNLKSEPRAVQATTTVSPRHGANEEGPRAYRIFAADLEQVLARQGYRVMVSEGEDEHRGGGLRLLRFGPGGLGVTLGAQAGVYAPLPLANGPVAAQAGAAVWNFDLDQALDDFLHAFDRLLQPAAAADMALRFPAALAKLLDRKRRLAAALAARVAVVTAGVGDLATAQAAYRDAMLVRLAAYYDVDAVVLVAATTAAPAGLAMPEGSTLKLYGRPARSGMTPSVDTGPGKIAMTPGAASVLSIPVRSARKGLHSSIALPPTFRVEAVQDVTGAIDTPDGSIDDGGWMHFVTAAPGADLALPVAAPVLLPYRRCPQPPTVQALTCVPVAFGADEPTLAQAKSWRLRATYRNAYHPSDSLEVAVSLAIPGGQAAAGSQRPQGANDGLRDALAQFSAFYRTAQADLAKLGDRGDPGTALDTFIDDASAVAAALESSAAAAPAATSAPLRYAVIEAPGADQVSWSAILAPYSANRTVSPLWTCPVPAVAIGDYVACAPDGQGAGGGQFSFRKGGDLLPATSATGSAARTLEIGPIDVLDIWSGSVGLTLYRNVACGAPFISCVAGVSAVPPATVHQVVDARIDLARAMQPGPGRPKVKVTEAIAFLFGQLLTTPNSHPGRWVRASLSTSLAITRRDGSGGAFPVQSTPIASGSLLRLRINGGSEAVIQQMAQKLLVHVARTLQGLVLEADVSHDGPHQVDLRFEVSIQPDGTDPTTPALRLTNLVVPLANCEIA